MGRSQSFSLIVNPRAGAGAARRRLPALREALREAGASFETVITSAPGEATLLAGEALRRGLGGVAVVGGDGTLNEVVNGFFGENGEPFASEAWVMPLPCGTGGDFRRAIGTSTDVRTMVTRAMWAKPRAVDVGWLTFRDHDGRQARRAFMNIASFGMGGLVDKLVNAGPKWMGGRAAFFLGSVRALGQYSSRRVRISLDDGPARETDVLNVAVANGRFFGGGMHIAPDAELDDGLFDVVGLEELGWFQALRLMPDLYRGTLSGKPGVTHARARRVVAEPAGWDGPTLLDVDGEAPGELPAIFEVKPAAILLRA